MNATMLRTGKVLLFTVLAGMTLACSEKPGESKSIDKHTTEDTTAVDVKKEAQDLVVTLDSYGEDRRDEALQAIDTALDELDQRLTKFEARVDESVAELNEAARKKAQSSVEMLREQRAEVAESYETLESSSDDAWNEIWEGFSDAYASITNALEKAEQEFEPGA